MPFRRSFRAPRPLVVVAVASLVAAAPAAADRCCYAVCVSPTSNERAVLVGCRPAGMDCERSVGTCMVWAHRDAGVSCSDVETCPAGFHENAEAQALLTKLEADPKLVVTREATFKLSNESRMVFTPKE